MVFFERHLTAWVILCIFTGIGFGRFFGDLIAPLNNLNIYQINIPIALLVWFMIFPMMAQIDFKVLFKANKSLKGLGLTLTLNWLIKPFTMAFFAWLFLDQIFASWISTESSNEYIAGAILLGAAPCTAMVFVWSYLTKGDPEYTLLQVAVNDLILLIAFIPIVKLLLGVAEVYIPLNTLLYSILIFVVIPLTIGFLTNRYLIKTQGKKWYESVFLPKLKPVSIFALLSTLILLFSFQGDKIIESPLHILLIAVPLTIQTYFIFFIAWALGKKLKIPHKILAPSSMIGASNFFELSVAVAIALFGLNSGAALATVVGVLIEVPVMLSLVKIANRWRY